MPFLRGAARLSIIQAPRRALAAVRSLLLAAAVAASALTNLAPGVAQAAAPAELKLDYAYYSPESLVIKRNGWLEQELAPDHTQVKWVLSLGSNRALEYLNSGAIDIGSTAGLAAVLGKANGNPIRAIYVFSRPEWTALVVRKDSPIRTLADLKGKKIAATKGTDPFLFTLRALHSAGLSRDDVETRESAASRWPHRARQRSGGCVGRSRSAHGRRADRRRRAAAVPQRRLQYLGPARRARGVHQRRIPIRSRTS